LFEEILGKRIEVLYNKTQDRYHHYHSTPYSFEPSNVVRINAEAYTDLGEGIKECLRYENECGDYNGKKGTEKQEYVESER
jgi:hypothetical protein